MIRDLVSVIIPVYNAEMYLKNCLDSVLAQTYHDIEIILIDDGSKDCSAKICDEYAAKDSRIKVLHKKNEGVSKARNAGIEMSSGEYLSFVDADDTIDRDYISLMYQEIISNEVEFVRLSWERGGIDYTYHVKFDEKGRYTVTDDNLDDLHLFENRWGLFRASSNIMFNENLKNGEDTLFVIESFIRSNTRKMLLLNKPYYHHTIVENSASDLTATQRLVAHKKFLNQVLELKDIYPKIVFLVKKHAYSDYFSVMCDMINRKIKFEDGFSLDEIQKCVVNLRKEGAKYTGFKENLKFFLYRYRLISIFKLLKRFSKVIGK